VKKNWKRYFLPFGTTRNCNAGGRKNIPVLNAEMEITTISVRYSVGAFYGGGGFGMSGRVYEKC
jgi:hypothetical protein